MDPQRLASNLRELGRALDRTCARAVIEVAQTARRETHSGLVFGLEEPERADPERNEYDETPNCRKTRVDENHGERRGQCQRDVAEPSALRLASRADIRNHRTLFSGGSGLRKQRI